MNLRLNKPLCVFDLETTGTNTSHDRIVEISILKVFPDGEKKTWTKLVNPEMPIPKEASEVHGISDEDVKDAPTFKKIAPEVLGILKGSDLAGFNSDRFDIPLLAEELLRNGFEFEKSKFNTIDIQVIFHKMEPRTLSAAYKFYCDKNLNNAHSAEADTLATFEVLDAQIGKYDELSGEMKSLSEFSKHHKFADFAGFIAFDKEEKEIFTFGKYKGKRVEEVLSKDIGYYSWIQNADFPMYTKKVLTGIKLRQKNS